MGLGHGSDRDAPRHEDFGESQTESRCFMSGYGSGRRLDKKETVEGCIVLSSAALMRIGLLRSNLHRSDSVKWTNTVTGEQVSAVGFDPNLWDEHGSARLHYTLTRSREQVDYRVQL